MHLSTTAPVRNFSGVRGGGVPNAVGLGRTVDRLLIRSADELSGLYGQLADGIALSPDGRSLHLRLHEKARWHDGVSVTTDDIRFSYDDYWGRDIPLNRRCNFDVIRYDVYRDATVAREAFRKGLFDIHFETDIGHWNASFDIPAYRDGTLKKQLRKVRKFV